MNVDDMTPDQLKLFGEIAEKFAAPLRERIEALETKLAAAEQKAEGALNYRGVWAEGDYPAGSAVTRNGALWVTANGTNGKPGTPDSGWQLAVKRAPVESA